MIDYSANCWGMLCRRWNPLTAPAINHHTVNVGQSNVQDCIIKQFCCLRSKSSCQYQSVKWVNAADSSLITIKNTYDQRCCLPGVNARQKLFEILEPCRKTCWWHVGNSKVSSTFKKWCAQWKSIMKKRKCTKMRRTRSCDCEVNSWANLSLELFHQVCPCKHPSPATYT